MSKIKLSLLVLLMSFFFVGATCSKIPQSKPVTTEQKEIEEKKKQVEETLDKIGKKDELQKAQAAGLAQGVNYSLNQITNPTVEVKTAITLNDRIMSILGSPKMDETKKIKEIVDLLNSRVEDEKKKGESLLDTKDKEISKLQKEKEKLLQEHDSEIAELSEQARIAAENADAKQQTLNAMGGWFGLNAVFWGIKKFFFTALTFIIVFVVLFIILRVLSTINPIAAAAFAFFDMIGSLVVSTFKALTPKAFEISRLVSEDKFNEYKRPLVKIIDTIQGFKFDQDKNPEKVITIQSILDEFEREMDKPEKDLIKKILKELNWKN